MNEKCCNLILPGWLAVHNKRWKVLHRVSLCTTKLKKIISHSDHFYILGGFFTTINIMSSLLQTEGHLIGLINLFVILVLSQWPDQHRLYGLQGCLLEHCHSHQVLQPKLIYYLLHLRPILQSIWQIPILFAIYCFCLCLSITGQRQAEVASFISQNINATPLF